MKFEIKSRFTGEIIFSIETDSWRLAVEAAVKSRANLSGADLSRADLSGADLYRANLSVADLSGANLSRADLSVANLSGADLSRADLSGANLYRANLSRANLSGANLSRADLSVANLSGADHTIFRDDFWAVLSAAPTEVDSLRQALLDGKVDGSTYEGECACLVGTIAKVKGCNYKQIPNLKPNAGRPVEVFFTRIRQGDTPVNNESAKLVLEWLDTWVLNMKEAFGGQNV